MKQSGIMAQPTAFYSGKQRTTISSQIFPFSREQQSASSREATTSILSTSKIPKVSGLKDGSNNAMESILMLL
jgi:hypothetical protein